MNSDPHWMSGTKTITPVVPEGDAELAAEVVVAGAGGYQMFSAHQMGSCRMGADPQTSSSPTSPAAAPMATIAGSAAARTGQTGLRTGLEASASSGT